MLTSKDNIQKLKHYVRPGLSLQQVAELKSTYDLFDTTGAHQVAPRDVQLCLMNLGLAGKSPTAFMMLAELEHFIK